MVTRADILQAYRFSDEEKHRLVQLLAKAYLMAKFDAYNQAVERTKQVLQILHPWQLGDQDVQVAQAVAERWVGGIIETYEAMLSNAIEAILPLADNEALVVQHEALGDMISKAKQIAQAISDWFARFLPWKTKQIAHQTLSEGADDGTNQFIEDALGDHTDGDPTKVRVKVVPEESSSDLCKDYAGQEYSLQEYWDLGLSFPAHVNCIHSAEIVPASGGAEPVESIRAAHDMIMKDALDGRTLGSFSNKLVEEVVAERVAHDMTMKDALDGHSIGTSRSKMVEELEAEPVYLFVDIDGVLSIPNAGQPSEPISGIHAWPIPQASAILQAIQEDKRIIPIWMSHWGHKSNGWNDRAGIAHWPVWFPLLEERIDNAKYFYPDLSEKIQAMQYCLMRKQVRAAAWLQDGFEPEDRRWAWQANVHLINTTAEPIHALLLSDAGDVPAEVIHLVFSPYSTGSEEREL